MHCISSDPKPPNPPFSSCCIAFHIFVLDAVRDFKFGRWVELERGMVRSLKPFKFW